MSIYNVSTAAQLQGAISAAVGGDTIVMAAGNYGNLVFSGKNYASDVTFTSASVSSPAVFSSIVIQNSSHLKFSGIDVNLVPTSTTMAWSAGVSVSSSSYVTVANSTLTGGAAVNGVLPTATALDSTGNVIGYYTGNAIRAINSTGINITGDTIANWGKGVVLSKDTQASILNNNIHDTRTTPIDVADTPTINISGNTLASSHPWAWAQTYGDHGDFIHIWTDTSMTSAAGGVQVNNNIIEQGTGTAVLGIYLESNNNYGFAGAHVTNNAVLNGNFQGIRLENSSGGTITGNTLMQTSGASNDAPSILMRAGGGNNNISNNIAWQINDLSGATGTAANSVSNNTLVQEFSTTTAGYYAPSVVASLLAMTDPVAMHTYALGQIGVPGGGNTAGYTDTAANISASFDTLNANTSINAIVVSDSAPLTLSAGQVVHDTRALGEMTNANGTSYVINVSDTAADVTSAIDALRLNSHVSSVSISDGGTISMASSAYSTEKTLLAKIVSPYTLHLSGYTGTFSSVDITVNSAGTWTSKTLNNTDGSQTTTGYVGGLTFAATSHNQALTVYGSGDTFNFDTLSGNTSVTGYSAGHEVLNFNHLLFADAASVLASAQSDGAGGTVITASNGHTFDLVNVTLATLQGHTSDFHFY